MSLEQELRRFEAEARRPMASRSHPSVVLCRHHFEAGGAACLVVYFAEGLSLEELLRRREARGAPFDEEDLLALMKPLLEMLAAVNATGVPPGAIEPTNVIVRPADAQ